MPAISCNHCKKLISDQEESCPFCASPQYKPTPTVSIPAKSTLLPSSTPVTSWLVAVNILLFVACLVVDLNNGRTVGNILVSLGHPSTPTLQLFGMTGNFSWTCGYWWTLITASFLHGGLLHIYFNMSALMQLGEITRVLLGPSRVIITYIATGIGGFALSNVWSNAPTIGASCSIFGLMGVLLVFGHRRGGELGKTLRQSVLRWTIIGLAMGFLIPMINNAGHIGGLLTGLLLGAIFPARESTGESSGLQIFAMVLLCVSIVLVGWNALFLSKLIGQTQQMGVMVCENYDILFR